MDYPWPGSGTESLPWPGETSELPQTLPLPPAAVGAPADVLDQPPLPLPWTAGDRVALK
jgi:hypothetical protein